MNFKVISLCQVFLNVLAGLVATGKKKIVIAHLGMIPLCRIICSYTEKMYCEQERSLEVCCVFLNLERHNFLVTDKALHQRVDSKKCGIYLNFALFNFSDTILPLSGSKIRIMLNIFDRYFQGGNFLELQRTLPAWCIEIIHFRLSLGHLMQP